MKWPSRLKAPHNIRGHTKHFTVYVDPALGAGGKRDADVVLASCEADYSKISGYFGGLSAGPFGVILFSNPKGAHHLNCAATNLYCDAKIKPARGNHSEFLNVAELVEVFEAVQAKGWDCQKSNGEGLSRVLAAELYPAEVGPFAALVDQPQRLGSGRRDRSTDEAQLRSHRRWQVGKACQKSTPAGPTRCRRPAHVRCSPQ